MLIGFAVIALLDQVTKLMVRQTFELYESVPVIDGFFNITYIVNPGAAFGIFAGIDSAWVNRIFILITLAALPMVVYMYREVEEADQRFAASLILVGGGALGSEGAATARRLAGAELGARVELRARSAMSRPLLAPVGQE